MPHTTTITTPTTITTTTTIATTTTTTTTTTSTDTTAAPNTIVSFSHTASPSTNTISTTFTTRSPLTTTTTTITMPYITITTQETPRSRPSPYTSRATFTNFGLMQIRTECLEAHEDRCSICLEAYSDIDPGTKINICRHIFHRSCLITWLDSSSTCPMCRADLFVSAPPPPPYWSYRPLPSSRDAARDDRLGNTTSESTNPRRNLFERRGGLWRVPALPHVETDAELSMMVESEGRDGPDALDALATWRMAASEEGREMGGLGETPLDY